MFHKVLTAYNIMLCFNVQYAKIMYDNAIRPLLVNFLI